jgi:multiple RNA-binding domain-containing protein 1
VDRQKCKRSFTTLLVKNIAASVKDTELREVFERYGSLVRLLISPFNTLAIVEYTNGDQAKAAMRNLAYYKINHLMPIYLEYAPVGTLKPIAGVTQDEEESEKEGGGNEVQERQKRQIFVKNLNFDTREEQLETLFKEAGIVPKSVTIIRRSDTQ